MSPKNLGIWENPQISGYLVNSSNVWVFGEFPKCQGIVEISSHLRNFQNLKNIPHSNICRYLEISEIPRHLENFPDTQAFEKFLF